MYLPPLPPPLCAFNNLLHSTPRQVNPPALTSDPSGASTPPGSSNNAGESESESAVLRDETAGSQHPETAGDRAADTTSTARILLVDDDPEIIESVRYTLEANDYEVIVARDGNQAVALAERERPDLMILDMMMPKRSGFLVLEHLRRQLELPLPVIMITGNEGSRHQAYAELLGVSEYLHKPFSMDKLLAAVARLLPNA